MQGGQDFMLQGDNKLADRLTFPRAVIIPILNIHGNN